MRKWILTIGLALAFATTAIAGQTFNPFTGKFDKVVTVEEEDGSPSNVVGGTVKVTNGTLTDNGDGTYSLATSTPEADTLDTVTTRGASTANDITVGNALVLGSGADEDISITFNDDNNDSSITWMEDEDYLAFPDNLMVGLAATKYIYMGTTNAFLSSTSGGQLTIKSGAHLDLYSGNPNATTVNNRIRLEQYDCPAGSYSDYSSQPFYITGGDGGRGTLFNNGGAGADIIITAGSGGQGAAGYVGGDGGDINITAGRRHATPSAGTEGVFKVTTGGALALQIDGAGDANFQDGDITTTGTISGATVTDGTFSVTGGAITGASGSNSQWTNDEGYLTAESQDLQAVCDIGASTTTSVTAGSTYQAIIGDDGNTKSGYFTDPNGNYADLCTTNYGGYFYAPSTAYALGAGDGSGNMISFCDQANAMATTGSVYVTSGGMIIDASGGYQAIDIYSNNNYPAFSAYDDSSLRYVSLGDPNNFEGLGTGAGNFYDGSTYVNICDGSYGLYVTDGMNYASISGNGYGYFYDGTNTVELATGTYAINTTGDITVSSGSMSALSAYFDDVYPVFGGAYISLYNAYLKDGSDYISVDWNNRYLYANDGTTLQMDWSTPYTVDFQSNAVVTSPSIDEKAALNYYDGADTYGVYVDMSEFTVLTSAGHFADSFNSLSVDICDFTNAITATGTVAATTFTENGQAVYNAGESCGGELGGTWSSPTIDDSLAVTSWNLTTPTITTSLTTDGKTISEAEIGILDGGIEGTEILSTGESGGTKFLREDGDGTCSWQTAGGSISFGADNQIPYTNGTTDDFDYSANFTFDGVQLSTQTSGVLATTKHAGYFYSNHATVAADAALVKIHQDNVSASEPALEIDNDGSGAAIEVDGGWIINNTQPSFNAYKTVAQDNVANGTTVTFEAERLDKGSNFNLSTETFTAPVTGTYIFTYHLRVDFVDADHTLLQPALVTSNCTYYEVFAMDRIVSGDDYFYLGFSVVTDMDASDTAYVQYNWTGGTNTDDITTNSCFTGALLS